ncbi:hypothetical protein [uncultured Christiangramia sp.]|uniref:hypothetical protein n=1 Tax=uncultured Christiangramia sp. TaxID=503836 RepID=UPI002615431B|nr:hypothetical protein [uncultured Christiangramia sp.]
MTKKDSFYKGVRDRIYEAGLAGADSPEDKKLILDTIEKFLDENLNNDTKIIIDHSDDILTKARKFRKEEQYDYAKIFYALFFEHIINDIIFYFCITRKIQEKERKEITRSINISGKYSWLLQIFGFPKFKDKHLKTIKKLAEERNAFIHYKWTHSFSLNEKIDREEKEIDKREFQKIEKTVRYTKAYNKKIRFEKGIKNSS